MPAIKPIEGRSVHQIQSGQVISDGLCSAVKELVENSLDAHATSIDIRFKNYGLEIIEVCDNGDGITTENYEGLALKHYTSKLRSYDDLDNVETYGFRGEALSSLCALSILSVVTATKDEAPKGTKLEFEISGLLKSKSVIAATKGTTVTVDSLFKTLPVRRRELERNIKREYAKVLNYLQAYASICVGVKFTFSNSPAGGKKTTVFSTKLNKTTKENIANIFGIKTLTALVPLELEFEIAKTIPLLKRKAGQSESSTVNIKGHISRPSVGEGRQTPDRQMFFVNSRPCNLPQVSRAFNEIYKTYNITQSPFIFANMIMDTNAYDVNVSPDKRTILLHDQTALIDSLKKALTELFDDQDQIIPHASQSNVRALKQLTLNKPSVPDINEDEDGDEDEEAESTAVENGESSESQQSSSQFPPTAPDTEKQAVTAEIQTSPFTSPSKLSYDQKGKIYQAFAKSHKAREDSVEADEPSSPTPAADNEEEQEVSNKKTSPAKPISRLSLWDRMQKTSSSIRSSSQPQSTVAVGSKLFATAGVSNKRALDSTSTIGQRSTKSAKTRISAPFSQRLRSLAAPGAEIDKNPEPVVEDESEPEDEDYDGEIAENNDMELDEEAVTQNVSHDKIEIDDVADHSDDADDADYIDSKEQSERERRTVDELIRIAEDYASRPSTTAQERSRNAFSSDKKDLTVNLSQTATTSLEAIRKRSKSIIKLDSIRDATKKAYSQDQSMLSGDEERTLAEERLSLIITKSDFKNMRINGQFNLGFILATRTSNTGKDLFIIDQHASDEKYNFERLQAETVVQNQPLVVPRVLDLTALEEHIVIENIEMLKKNGFLVALEKDAETGRKCKLMSLPMSKDVVFGAEDLEELIHLIHQNPNDSSLRPSKVRRMFAMRACRSSIMIGKTLTFKTMKKVVNHMGELDKPWNCPHGRPTMRHVWDINQMQEWRDDAVRDLKNADWSALLENEVEEE